MMFKLKIFYLWIIFFATNAYAANYYWVGGSGNWNDINHWRTTSGGSTIPSVQPGILDNVFFDANSGFTASSKTVTLIATANCHNITFAGSSVAPTLNQSSAQTLNIYGSSEWQTGMPTISITNIYYRHTGEAKTIKSNGVPMGLNVIFEEENSISLLDDLDIRSALFQMAGTWNTNNYKANIEAFYNGSTGVKPRTLNLGSSEIFVGNEWEARNALTTVNAGTSHIQFNGAALGNKTMRLHSSQAYYNVTFLTGTTGVIERTAEVSAVTNFNQLDFKQSGYFFSGNSRIKDLIFAPTKAYSFNANLTQTITGSFTASTPSCGGWSTIQSAVAGTRSNIVAAAGVVINVNGAIIKDIAASGGANFTANNSVDNGNNTGWIFPAYTGQNLYWVGGTGNWNDKSHWSLTSGGAGGACIPGPGDNVFFDGGSSFTAANKTITVDNISYCHNITFAGSSVAPTLNQSGGQTLNIYGSSEWQTGMPTISITNIYYRHTGEAKTIKSNGVPMGLNVLFEEENSISLLDDLDIRSALFQMAGTWNTNNYKVNIAAFFRADSGIKTKVINLGTSEVFVGSEWNTNNAVTTVNAGTSHIQFANNSTLNTLGQTYNNITFIGAGTMLSNNSTKSIFKTVKIFGSGNIFNGSNDFENLVLTGGKTYTLQTASTQTVKNLILGGSPCTKTTIVSRNAGSRANLSVTGSNVSFNFADIRDINAIGQTLYFGELSNNLGNNNNLVFEPYNPSGFDGLGDNWLNHEIVATDPSTYLIKTDGFYGNPSTTYTWYKLDDAAYNPTTPISTASEVDIRVFGFGRYKIEVKYYDAGVLSCSLTEEILIVKKKIKINGVYVNPNLRTRVSQ